MVSRRGVAFRVTVTRASYMLVYLSERVGTDTFCSFIAEPTAIRACPGACRRSPRPELLPDLPFREVHLDLILLPNRKAPTASANLETVAINTGTVCCSWTKMACAPSRRFNCHKTARRLDARSPIVNSVSKWLSLASSLTGRRNHDGGFIRKPQGKRNNPRKPTLDKRDDGLKERKEKGKKPWWKKRPFLFLFIFIFLNKLFVWTKFLVFGSLGGGLWKLGNYSRWDEQLTFPFNFVNIRLSWLPNFLSSKNNFCCAVRHASCSPYLYGVG